MKSASFPECTPPRRLSSWPLTNHRWSLGPATRPRCSRMSHGGRWCPQACPRRRPTWTTPSPPTVDRFRPTWQTGTRSKNRPSARWPKITSSAKSSTRSGGEVRAVSRSFDVIQLVNMFSRFKVFKASSLERVWSCRCLKILSVVLRSVFQ